MGLAGLTGSMVERMRTVFLKKRLKKKMHTK